MNYTVMTKHKYRDYLKEIHQFYNCYQKRNWKKAKVLGRDIVYTFLHYYHHIGQTPARMLKGADMVHVVNQFQGVFNKHDLKLSVSTFSCKYLCATIRDIVSVVSLWVYTTSHRLIRFRYQFKNYNSARQIMNVLRARETKIATGHQLCVWFKITDYSAEFDVVNYDDILCPLPKLKSDVKKHRKRW